MPTYYGKVRMHTLLEEKQYNPEHRKGVCCRGKLTDRGRYRRGGIRRYALGCRQGVLRAILCTSCQLLPIVVLVLYPPIRDAVVVHLAERVLLPDSFTTVVPIGNSRSASSRGRVMSVFARSFVVLEVGVGCTDSTVHRNHRAVVC